MEVVFTLEGARHAIAEEPATTLAETLRRAATGALGPHGIEGARHVADRIEDVLVGRSDAPIPIHDERADAVLYALDHSDLEDPAAAELSRALRRETHGE